MSACTHCQLARELVNADLRADGYIRCGHRISADTMAIIRARVHPKIASYIAESNEAFGPIMHPADQPARCPVRVPPHAAPPQQAAA